MPALTCCRTRWRAEPMAAGRLAGQGRGGHRRRQGTGRGGGARASPPRARASRCSTCSTSAGARGRARASAAEAARYFHCDVSDEGARRRARSTAPRGASAGSTSSTTTPRSSPTGGRIADMRSEDWDRTIAVNLRGPFLCAKYALPHLVARGGGAIINVSSHGAFQASPDRRRRLRRRQGRPGHAHLLPRLRVRQRATCAPTASRRARCRRT